MKQLLITFNVIFLLFGNVFFLNIHSSHEHHNHGHNHTHEHENIECIECFNIDNNSNCIAEFQELFVSNNCVSTLVFKSSSIFDFNINRIYDSRAPPIS